MTLRVTIYRPPPAHDGEHDLTRSFARFWGRWPLFVAGDGNQPVSVSLAGNVGSAVAALAEADDPPLIVIHSYEGQTVRSLYKTFGAGPTIRSLPEAVARRAFQSVSRSLARASERASPRTAVASQDIELLLLGQAQITSWLTATGSRPPLGRPAWRQVALAAASGPSGRS